MPAIDENSSELLKESYHHLRHPEKYRVPEKSPAFEARLHALRARTSPPLPSLKEVWRTMTESWKEAGAVWEQKLAQSASDAKQEQSAQPLPR
jgi:hypothetical protein